MRKLLASAATQPTGVAVAFTIGCCFCDLHCSTTVNIRTTIRQKSRKLTFDLYFNYAVKLSAQGKVDAHNQNIRSGYEPQ